MGHAPIPTLSRPSGAAAPFGVFLLVGFLYLLGAELAWSSFGAPTGFAFFAPAGITVAALLLSPRSYWPAIAAAVLCAEFFVDLQHELSVGVSALYALANTVEPLVGAVVTLRLAGPVFDLSHRRSVYSYLAGACVAGPLAGSIIGTVAKTIDGTDSQWPALMLQWWAGDGVAALVIGAPIVLLVQGRKSLTPHRIDLVIITLTVLIGTSAAYYLGVPPAVVGLPVLAWAAYRVGATGVLVVGALLALVTNFMTAAGYGVLADLNMDASARIALTQLYIAVLVLVGWLVSLEVAERTAAAKDSEIAQREAAAATKRAAAARLGDLLADAIDPQTAMSRMTEAVRNELESGWVAVNLLAADGKSFAAQYGVRPQITAIMGALRPDSLAPGPTALRRGELVFVPDNATMQQEFPEGQQMAQLLDTETVAAAPIRTEIGAMGYIVVGWHHRRKLDGAVAEYMTTVAEVAGRALERSRLRAERESAKRQADELARTHAVAHARSETLYQVSASLSRALTRDEVVHIVQTLVRPTLECETVEVGLVDGQETIHWISPQASAARDYPQRGDNIQSAALAVLRTGDGVLSHSEPTSWFAWPLWAPGGLHPLGVVGGHWSERRVEQEGERAFIATVAGLVAQALTRAQAFSDEQLIAATLQKAVMPETSPRITGFDIGSSYQPASRRGTVGGDWYDALELPKGDILFCVGDVVGHGIAAAQDMNLLRNATRAFAMQGQRPQAILSELSNLTEHASAGGMATMAIALWEPTIGELCYAVAGHPPAAIHRSNAASAELIDAEPGPPLGVHGSSSYQEYAIPLIPGDVVVLYSDGLIERRSEDVTKGFDRLLDAMSRMHGKDPEGLCSGLVRACTEVDAEQHDDVCLLVMRLRDRN